MNIKRLKYNLFSFILINVSLSMSILSGMFSYETTIEKSADYAAQLVESQTTNGQYCSLAVDRTSDSGDVLNPNMEFNNLYGVFRQTRATFASFYNFDKSNLVNAPEIDDNNYSFLYLGPIGSKEYKGHYKTNQSPIEIMFEDENFYSISRYVVYLSQSQADKLLIKRGIEKTDGAYKVSDYKNLISTTMQITINSVTDSFVINNIYYETNYYFDCLHENVGEFFMMSYYLPVSFSKTNVYFLSKYSYQNDYFLRYVLNNYSNRKYQLSIGKRNIIGDFDEGRVINYYYQNSSNSEWAMYVLLAGSFVTAMLYFYFFWSNKLFQRIDALIVSGLSLFIPFSIFKIIYSLNKNVTLFSAFGMRMNLILMLVFVIGCIFITLFLINKTQKRSENIYFETIDI